MKPESLPNILYRKDDGVRFLLNEDKRSYSMEKPQGIEGHYRAWEYLYETLMDTGAFTENIHDLRWPSEEARMTEMKPCAEHAICIHCGETNELALFQLRNGHNDLIGMAFVCKGCVDIASNIKLVINGIRGHGPGSFFSHSLNMPEVDPRA